MTTEEETSKMKKTEDGKACSKSLDNFKYPTAAYIILIHELLERFSFYGMKGILTLYLKLYIGLNNDMATIVYHIFTGVCYLIPIFGAIISDNYWGRYKTVVIFGMVYMAGHLLMPLTSITPNLPGPLIGIFVLAIGSGIIKPCVAAFGGDQIPKKFPLKLETFFSLFYASINVGAFISQVTTPILRKDVKCFEKPCYLLAFGVPAFVFLLTYIIFVASKKVYQITPTEGNVLSKFVRCVRHAIFRKFDQGKTLKKESLLDYADDKFDKDFINDAKITTSVMVLFIPFPIFWALFDQQGSRWTLQAESMNGYISSSISIKPEQMQAMNPLLICFFIPLFDMVIYPALSKCNLLKSPTSRIVAGYIFAAGSFVIAGFLQIAIDKGLPVDIATGRSHLQLSNLANQSINVYSPHWTSPITLGSMEIRTEVIEVSAGMFNLTTKEVGGSAISQTLSTQINASSTSATSIFMSSFNIQNGIINRSVKSGFQKTRVILTFVPEGNVSIIASLISTKNTINRTLINWTNDTNQPSQTLSSYSILNQGKYELFLLDINGIKKIDNFEVKSIGSITLSIFQDTDKIYRVLKVTELSVNLINIGLQLPQYIVMTCAEILLSVTAMTFAYSVAPASMKALLQSIYLLTIFVGNIIVTIVVSIPTIPSMAWEFFVFAILVAMAGALNLFLALQFERNLKVTESIEENDSEVNEAENIFKENEDASAEITKL